MNDQRITACMLDDFIHDPVLAVKVLLGNEFVQPTMEMQLWGAWTSQFFVDSSGFGIGKTHDMSLLAVLRASLFKNRHQGLCSKGFAQGKEIHKRCERWIQRSAILMNEVILNSAGEITTKGSDAWETKFKNGSLIRTVPPDFKAGGERLGSEDWTDGYFDEWTKYPNFQVFMRQLFSRVRKPVDKEYDITNPIFDRHFYLGGTAKAQWHACFGLVHDWTSKVKAGSKIHEVQSWNFHDVPKEFHFLLNMNAIQEQHDNMMIDLVQQEVLGIWTSDSSGFYNFTDVEYARTENCPILLERAE